MTDSALYPFSIYLHFDLHGSACNLRRDDSFIQSLKSGGLCACKLHQDVSGEVLEPYDWLITYGKFLWMKNNVNYFSMCAICYIKIHLHIICYQYLHALHKLNLPRQIFALLPLLCFATCCHTVMLC